MMALFSRIPIIISGFIALYFRDRWGLFSSEHWPFSLGIVELNWVCIYLKGQCLFWSCDVCLATAFVVPWCHEIQEP